MFGFKQRTRGFVLLLLLGLITLLGCDVIEDLIEDLVGGLEALCSAPEFLVTKEDDTNDGLCTSDDCSLREAIVMANGCPGHQTIRVPIGTYVLSRHGAGEDDGDTGDLDITDDLTILGDVLPTIDGDAADRVFDVLPSVVVSMENLIIQNGQEGGGAGIQNAGDLTITQCSVVDNHAVLTIGASMGGGIISIPGASLTIEDSEVINNTAIYGGGIGNVVSRLVVTNSQIADNEASESGGGLWNNTGTRATLNDVAIEGNSAADDGGGIYNDGFLEINGGNLSRNDASRGGGLFIGDRTDPPGPAEATLNNVRIDNNTATDSGAGIWNGAYFELYLGEFSINSWPEKGGGMFNGPDAEAFLYDAWFSNNTADLGGGVYNQGLIHFYRGSFTVNSAPDGLGGAIYNDGAMPGVLLRNTTVSGNMADPAVPSGAGIYNHGGDLDIAFSTFAYNSHDGILNDSGGHMMIESSILAYQPVNCSGVGSPSGGYNIDDQDDCGFIEPSDMIDTDPMLAWLSMNGGSSLSHAPLPGSPAVDTGDPDMCIAEDQRGVSRPQGAGCDRGAIELTEDPLPLPTPPDDMDPISMEFTDDGNFLTLGQCTTLHWIVRNADEVTLNGAHVDHQGLDYICPQATTTYILRGWNSYEQRQEAITVEVEQEPPPNAPVQFSIGNRVCDLKIYSVTLEWIDMSDNELGFYLYRDGSLIATLPPNTETYTDHPPRGAAHTYGIEAYNNAGVSARPTLQEAICQ